MKKLITTTALTLILISAYSQQINLNADLIESTNQSTVFIENKGQVFDQNYNARPDVLFSGEYQEMVFHLKNSGLSYQLFQYENVENSESPTIDNEHYDSEVSIYRIDMNWIGSNADFIIEKGKVTGPYRNYYNTGSKDGIPSVRSYENITYTNLYQDIDLKWYERNGQLEYDYILHPNADHTLIRWKIEGANELNVNDEGQLVLKTPFGIIYEDAPIAFQDGIQIAAEWKIEGNQVGFDLAEYDKSRELIIDPVIRLWGTYMGGSGNDQANACEIDGSSNLYIAGSTHSSTNIATSGAFQTSIGGLSDGFISKFDSSGTLLWSSYFGSVGTDFGEDCALDAASNVYLTGWTQSGLTLGTSGTHQPSYGGGFQDAFLAKFNSSGVRQWSTYYGGKNQDRAYCVAVDYISNIYIGGYTLSDSAIATTGCHQANYENGDAFLAKFSTYGGLIWGTYYGDSAGTDDIRSIETDMLLNVYVAGNTQSSTKIATSGAYQTSKLGIHDAFVAKFNYSGTRLWASYYGGTGDEAAFGCNVDDSMNVYITGYTTSTTNIATNNSYQNWYGGSYWDGYLVKFNTNGARQWATYYGGDGIDVGYDIAIDSGNVYVSGLTYSSNQMASYKSHQTSLGGGRDAFLAKFNKNGNRIWGSYYGGTNWDYGNAIAVDKSHNVFMAGRTKSAASIATSGSHQTTLASSNLFDAYIAKFRECLVDSSAMIVSECLAYTSPSSKYTWSESGTYYDTLMNVGGCDSIIRVELTILKSTSQINVISCGEYQTPSGKRILTESGTYKDTLVNANNCDSIITIKLTVGEVNTNVSVYPPSLSASAANATYQWIDCDNNNAIIPGATASQYTATSNGRYAVIVTDSICSDTSNCYEITVVGIEQNRDNPQISVYPNPAKDRLYIRGSENYKEYYIFNSQGSVVDQGRLSHDYIDVQNLTNGIYILQMQITGQILQQRFIIRK